MNRTAMKKVIVGCEPTGCYWLKWLMEYSLKLSDERGRRLKEGEITELNAQTYYCSKGLKKAEVVETGYLKNDYVHDFENDYVKVDWFENPDEAFDKINPFDFFSFRQSSDINKLRISWSKRWLKQTNEREI